MSQKQYYYSPAYAGYLRELKSLASHGGGISAKNALYADIASGETLSPEQTELFYRYYGNDIEKLKQAVDHDETAMRRAWLRFLSASDALGIARDRDKNGEDFKLYKRFYDHLKALEENCDLRAMVHNWVNEDFRRIKKGTATLMPSVEMLADGKWVPLQPLSVPVIMERYEALLQKRKARAHR